MLGGHSYVTLTGKDIGGHRKEYMNFEGEMIQKLFLIIYKVNCLDMILHGSNDCCIMHGCLSFIIHYSCICSTLHKRMHSIKTPTLIIGRKFEPGCIIHYSCICSTLQRMHSIKTPTQIIGRKLEPGCIVYYSDSTNACTA